MKVKFWFAVIVLVEIIASSVVGGSAKIEPVPPKPIKSPGTTTRNQNNLLNPTQTNNTRYVATISATASSPWVGSFLKVVYGTPMISDQANIEGLRGIITTGNDSPNTFNQMLFYFGIASTCPSNGKMFTDYSALGNYLGDFHTLFAENIKGDTANGGGSVNVPIQVNFPVPLHTSGACAIIIMDFGTENGLSSVSANISIFYGVGQVSNPPVLVFLTSELCFNLQQGCQAATPNSGAYVIGSRISTNLYPLSPSIATNNYRLVALYGGISAGSLNPGSGFTAEHSFYIDRSCSVQLGRTGPYDHFDQLNNWTPLYSISINGGPGLTYRNQPYNQIFNLTISKDACIYDIASLTGTNAVDLESDPILELIPILPVLTLSVPAGVIASIDGKPAISGQAQISLNPGNYTIAVPAIVQVDNSTRLRFDHWSDSIMSTDRTITLDNDTTLEATYVTQYLLVVDSGVSMRRSSSGWYDQGSTVTLSAPSPELAHPELGLLGGRWIFDGWYEDGAYLTNSGQQPILMNRSHHLQAGWHQDYSIPIVIVVTFGTILTVFWTEMKKRQKYQHVGESKSCANWGSPLRPRDFCGMCGERTERL